MENIHKNKIQIYMQKYIFKSNDSYFVKNGHIYSFSTKRFVKYLLQNDLSLIIMNSKIKNLINKIRLFTRNIKKYKSLKYLHLREIGKDSYIKGNLYYK